MSSAVFSTSAAQGRPFIFDAEPVPDVCLELFSVGRPPQPAHPTGYLASADPRLSSITPASRLDVRPAPEMASSGIAAIDALTGGLPRGCLTEICGPASSGRTTLLLAALAAATARGEFCVVVDASDALDPHSVAAAGVKLDRLLWVRCGDDPQPKSRAKQDGRSISRAPLAREACPEIVERGLSSQAALDFDSKRQSERRLEQLLRATDLLLERGGFGLIVLDICDVTPQAARRIPLTTWFRFRRAVEQKPTVLLAFEQQPIAGSCSSLLLQLGSQNNPQGAMNNREGTMNSPEGAMNNPERAMKWKYSGSSREAASWESPARQCRVAAEKTNESHRDGNEFVAGTDTNNDLPEPQIAPLGRTHLLTGLNINVELIRSRVERKPVRSVTFATKTAWAG